MSNHPVLLVALPLTAPLRAALEGHFTLHLLGGDSEQVLAEHGAAAVGLLTSALHRVDKALLDRLPNLRIVACSGVGVDAIDLVETRRRGIAVTNTPAVLDASVANLAVALLLAVTRKVVEADHFVRAGKWLEGKMPLSDDIAGKLCGIVGLGGIGQAIAERAKVLGMNIAYYGRHPKPVDYTYYDDLVAMARDCDVLILSIPGTAETRHLINADVLNALGPTGYLINVARGSVVDEAALIACLQAGGIAGAGLDVFEHEPRVPDALLAMQNVVLLPHIASGTHETRNAMGMLAINNLHAFFKGASLLTPVQ